MGEGGGEGRDGTKNQLKKHMKKSSPGPFVPQVFSHSSLVSKLLPFPPQPPQKNLLQDFAEGL